MSWAVANQIIRGAEGQLLKPQDKVKRAECAAIIHRYTITEKQPVVTGASAIYDGKQAAPIIIDAAYTNNSADAHAGRTYNQIVRAVGDLRQDIAMVTGAIDFEEIQQIFKDSAEKQADRLTKAEQSKVPQLLTDTSVVKSDYAIIVGSVSDSAIIQKLTADGKLSEADAIKGQREAFVIKEVENPTENIKKALVIAGADARGTIYGIYTISEEIGVSPWYWMSDAPVAVKDQIQVNYSTAHVEGTPSVKYRGIFINDEEPMREWAYYKYGYSNQISDPGFYNRVFELMLRLKMNTLWPAMHEYTEAFNNVVGEDGEQFINAKNANTYGLIMSSAHNEILLRNPVGEWEEWYNAHKDEYDIKGSGYRNAWDWTRNKKALLAFWDERLETHGEYENIYELGIRGVRDSSSVKENLDGFVSGTGDNCINPAIKVDGTSKEAKVSAMMKDIIYEQRQLIKKHFGSEDAVPQCFLPYNEMAIIYGQNNGDVKKWMAQNAPDVMLMWSNDNYGHLRQLPDASECAEGRSNGIYYHISYWGPPKPYLWLNSQQIQLMDTELRRAYNRNAGDYWILNVGDIKPGDILMEYFGKMSWDIEKYNDSTIPQYLKAQAKRDYLVSDAVAEEIADCWNTYYQYQGTKRAEQYNYSQYQGTFSNDIIYKFSPFANGDEAARWVNQWDELYDKMEAIYNDLPVAAKDAFYEQMLHAVRSARDVARMNVYWWKHLQAVEQGRYGSSLVYKDLSLAAVQDIKAAQNVYWTLNSGKWDHAIDYEQFGRGRTGENGETWTSYNWNPGMTMIGESNFKSVNPGTGIGAQADNADKPGDATLKFHNLTQDVHYFDVFGKGEEASEWSVEAVPEWVKLTDAEGTLVSGGSVYTETRVLVSIDWKQVTESKTGTITVKNAGNETVATFTVEATVEASHLNEKSRGYQETNGYVMLEAEHYSRTTAGSDGAEWTVVNHMGQRGDSLRVVGGTNAQVAVDTNANAKSSTATVEYDIYFSKTGTYKGYAFRMPSFDEVTLTCRTGVALDDGNVTLLRGLASVKSGGGWDWPTPEWEFSNVIKNQAEMLPFEINVQQAGWHTLKLYRYSPDQMFDRILLAQGTVPAMNAGKASGKRSDVGIGPAMSPNNIADASTLRDFQLNEIGVLPREITWANRSVAFKPMELCVGETRQIEFAEGVEGYTIQSCESRNTTAVEGNDDNMLTAKRAGIATVKVTCKDSEGNMASGTLSVKVLPAEWNPAAPYTLVDGLAIDTADVLRSDEYAKMITGENNHTWELGENGMVCTPDNGGQWPDTNQVPGKAPGLAFTVNVSDDAEGQYYIYVNQYGKDTGADSFHIFVDNQHFYTPAYGEYKGTRWFESKNTINLTAGEHTITIFAREDGVCINQLYFSKNKKTLDGFVMSAGETRSR